MKSFVSAAALCAAWFALPVHAWPELDAGGQSLRLAADCPPLRVAVAPKFVFARETVAPVVRRAVAVPLAAGRPVRLACEPAALSEGGRLEATIAYQWSAEEKVLRKWVRFRVSGGPAQVLREIQLETLEPAAPATTSAPGEAARSFVHAPLVRSDAEVQSYPVFFDGGFAGVEFPIARTETAGDGIRVAYAPGLRVQPNTWYETRRAVIGGAPVGGERAAFLKYLERHRPSPRGLHFNYNSWWTSPVPYTERDILTLMSAFEQQLFRPYGTSFDTFAIDMGWTERQSIWRIDPQLFPAGFAPLNDAAVRMKTRLGLWVSPSGCYSGAGGSMDNKWAHAHGYETFKGPRSTDPEYRYVCLGGERYCGAIRDGLVDMVGRRGVRHLKFDGYRPTCPEAGHGHAPGNLSADAIAGGIIDVFTAVRRAAPDTWMEATCFGWNPSPWWLFHVNSVIGTFGDDAPPGRVPCPIWRESYTTARDFFNLQGTVHLPIPAAAQEVLGIIHQTSDPLLNDAVVSVMRGHMFQPVYVNPAHMTDGRWRQLAELLRWARRHEQTLMHTVPILPESWKRSGTPRFTSNASMPRETYGYAHWGSDSGLVAVRNPWIERQSVSVDVPEALQGGREVVSVYPRVRSYAATGEGGLRVELAPYETLVLAVGRAAAAVKTSPPEGGTRPIAVEAKQASVKRVVFRSATSRPFGADYTNLLGDRASGVRLALDATVEIREARADLLILLESREGAPTASLARFRVDGVETDVAASESETAWRASGEKRDEHWRFLGVPLEAGRRQLSVEVVADEPCTASAWLWAYEPNGDHASAQPDVLPAPERISLDSVALLAPTASASLRPDAEQLDAPVERINGVYLDALEPVSASQGWGRLQRNRSVWGRPMTVGGRGFLRGVGTHAPARLTYRIEPQYRRFQAWVGVDGAVNGSIACEIWLDGVRKWESGRLTRATPAVRVDLDVSGLHTLELVVTDGGDNIGGDHADWADARLLK